MMTITRPAQPLRICPRLRTTHVLRGDPPELAPTNPQQLPPMVKPATEVRVFVTLPVQFPPAYAPVPRAL